MNVGGMNESERHALSGVSADSGEVTTSGRDRGG
jgi:hypothetical protein